MFDIETTGFSPIKNKIIEIGAVKVRNGEIIDRMDGFVDPEVPIPFDIRRLTRDQRCHGHGGGYGGQGAAGIPRVCGGCGTGCPQCVLRCELYLPQCGSFGTAFRSTVLDTVTLARALLPNLNRFKLGYGGEGTGCFPGEPSPCRGRCGRQLPEFSLKFVEMLKTARYDRISTSWRNSSQVSDETIVKMPTYHVIIIAKNDLGREPATRLVSWSHLRYFSKEAEGSRKCAEPMYRRG